MFNQAIVNNTNESVVIRGIPIRLYVKEHFTMEELSVLVPDDELLNYEYIISTPFEEIFKMDLNSIKTDSTLFEYFRLLSLCQRISFSLDEVFESFFIQRYNKYSVFEKLDNFQTLNRLIEENYDEWFKSYGDDKRRYERDVNDVRRLVYRLWCAGYGLLEKSNLRPITNEILINGNKIKPLIAKKKICVFISYCLSRENESPITEVINFTPKKSKFTSERESWDITLENFSKSDIKTELIESFQTFIFGPLYERTKKDYMHKYINSEGSFRNETYSQITMTTWRKYSRMLRYMAVEYFDINDCYSIQDVLDGKLFEVFSEVIKDYEKSSLGDFIAALSNWFTYYSKENQIFIDTNKIIPTSRLGRKTTKYGKQINFRNAVKLIEVLLDDQSPYHRENDLAHFRGRRICLLQLETGKRIHEIVLLKKECLMKNRFNDVFIEFHKTKTGKPSRIKISKEGQKWVKQLQSLAPFQPIEANSDIYTYGDDLKVERLLASSRNDRLYATENASFYLHELQKKIFGDEIKDGFFGTHDLRRMCATYMKIKGFSDEDIAVKLGHSDLKSQFTYTLTIANETLEKFGDMAERGLYDIGAEDNSHLDIQLSEKILDVSSILNTTAMIVDSVDDEEIAKSFIEKLFKEVKEIELPSTSYLPDGEAPTGFPMRTHNCNAHAKVTCFHHTLKCYKCSKYSPDSDMLREHKAELARWIVFIHHNETSLKKTKDKLEKRVLPVKIKDIKQDLNEAFKQLFIKFPQISEKEVVTLEKEVNSWAQKYIKKYYKKYPYPTVEQMNKFIERGEF